jgi:hypothetical protein
VKRLARWLRDLADRIDYEGAPKGMSYSFTFEPGEGIRFRADGRGCPLWYLGEADYLRAHREAGPAPGTGGQWQRPARRPYPQQEGPGLDHSL